MSEWVVWVPVALLGTALLVLLVVLLRDRTRGREQLTAAYALLAVLEERVAALEQARQVDPARRQGPDEAPTYVIASIAEPAPAPVNADRRFEGSLFADLVLRESMVKGISLAYGVGRALSPETRNRIRFLMRQEVKRSRKQRRIDLRAARRHLADLQRSAEDAA